MALKVKAVERKIKFTKDDNDPCVWRYVMQPDLHITLNQAKVIREASLCSSERGLFIFVTLLQPLQSLPMRLWAESSQRRQIVLDMVPQRIPHRQHSYQQSRSCRP